MYESPRIARVGSMPELTLGKGWEGNDDQFLFFSWGTDPKPGEPPVGS